MKGGAPATDRRVGALQGVMAKLLAVGTLGVLVEAKVSLQLEGGGQGRQLRRGGKVLCLRACDGDDDSGHACVGATVVRGKPSGPLRESEARVESGDLPGNSVKGVYGWIPCTRSCAVGSSKRTEVVPGMRCKNCDTWLLSEDALTVSMVIRVMSLLGQQTTR